MLLLPHVPLLHYFSLGKNFSDSSLCETIHPTAKASFDRVSITIECLLFEGLSLSYSSEHINMHLIDF